jgi:hypothetical protein
METTKSLDSCEVVVWVGLECCDYIPECRFFFIAFVIIDHPFLVLLIFQPSVLKAGEVGEHGGMFGFVVAQRQCTLHVSYTSPAAPEIDVTLT